MILEEAISVLAGCEAQLQQLVGRAAQAGDYESVIKLTQWAQTLAGVVSESLPPATDLHGQEVAPANLKSPPPPARGRGTKKSYPYFVRSDGNLVKIGWSKKSRSEYEHRAPSELVDQLAAAAVKVGGHGRVFQLNALAQAAGGADATPGYQLYLIVAWWRELGRIDQHGRKGYSIPRTASFVVDVERAFEALPVQSA